MVLAQGCGRAYPRVNVSPILPVASAEATRLLLSGDFADFLVTCQDSTTGESGEHEIKVYRSVLVRSPYFARRLNVEYKEQSHQYRMRLAEPLAVVRTVLKYFYGYDRTYLHTEAPSLSFRDLLYLYSAGKEYQIRGIEESAASGRGGSSRRSQASRGGCIIPSQPNIAQSSRTSRIRGILTRTLPHLGP